MENEPTSDDALDEFRRKLAVEIAAESWRYMEEVLADEEQLRGLGFAELSATPLPVVLYIAGDRLHPDLGFDYSGPNWRDLDREEIFEVLEDRRQSVEEITAQLLQVLEFEGPEKACQFAETVSKHRVIFVGRSRAESEACVLEMLQRGLGTNELTDDLLDKRGETLVLLHRENISYYYLGDSAL